MAMRYLGVDLGTKRIGLALADAESGIASPLKVIDAGPDAGDNARAILAVAEGYDVCGIVIGLPLNMDGTEGPQTRLSHTLAEAIRVAIESAAASQPVGREAPEIHLHDERLTSHAADQLLTGQDLTHKKKKARHDAVAAAVLLQSFTEARNTGQE